MPRSARRPGAWSALVGLSLGLGFSAVGHYFDTTLFAPSGALVHALHQAFDWILPPLCGLAGGLGVAMLRQRSALARAEARLAAQLQERLGGTERAQVVWVIASALLHELRTPLHALGLAVDEARRLAPEAEPLLAEGRAQIDRMTARILALRELADAPAGESKPYRLDALAAEVVAELEPLAARARVALTCALAPVTVRGDARLIRAALENLVGNAIEAASAGPTGAPGRARVLVQRTAAGAHVAVTDHGTGVPDALRGAIFEPLTSGKGAGLGLGLAIARALARAQGGDLELLRSLPGDTEFSLVLPVVSDEGSEGAALRG